MIGRGFICAALLLIGGGFCFGQDPVHRRYTTADGLPSNVVYCAFQDRDGFLWFGTEVGVSRFDGHHFMNLSLADGLSDNNVLVIEQDSQGRVWFLTLNGRLSFWLNGRIHNGSTVPDLAKYHSRHGLQTFAESADGLLWFGAIREDLVCVDLDGDRDTVHSFKQYHVDVFPSTEGGVLRTRIPYIEEWSDGGWSQCGSFEWRPGTNNSISTNIIYGPPAPKFAPVVADGSHFHEMTRSGSRLIHAAPEILGAGHTGCWRDGGGSLWIRKAEGGAYRWPKADSGYGPGEPYFPNERINFVILDKEEHYWFATRGDGVIMVTAQHMRSNLYQLGTGRPSAITALHRDGSGRVFAGTATGTLFLMENARSAPAPICTSATGLGRIRSFVNSLDGELFIATDRDLLVLDPSRSDQMNYIPAEFDFPTRLNAQPHYGAKSVVCGPTGTIWAPYMGMFTVVMDRNAKRRKKIPLGKFNDDRIYAVQEDNQGDLWFGVGPDLMHLVDDRITGVDALRGRTGLRISKIQRVHGDTLLIATMGQGVQVVHKGVPIDHWTTQDGLVSDEVSDLRVQGDTVLLSTPHGVTMLRYTDAGIKAVRNWTSGSGLPSDEVYDALIADGRLFAGCDEGLCILPLQVSERAIPPPPMYFARLGLNDTAILAPLGTLRLQQETDRLSVTFTTINFDRPEKDEYQYRLDPGSPWVESRSASLELSDMEPGSYQLEARGRRQGSDWSRPLHLRFDVVPVWWRSDLARAALGFAVLTILFMGLYQLSRRSDRRRMAALREQAALNEERRRIAADVHDDLGADLSRLLLYARQAEAEGGAAGTKISQGITATIDKIDEIIWSLDPRRDTLLSTVHFVEQLVQEMAEGNGLRFRTSVQVPEQDIAMPAEQRRELMLIAREAARNVVRHAGASELRVQWELANAVLAVRIVDDGTGFDPRTVAGTRHGLHNMRERADRIRGTLRIGINEPRGTCVELRIPFLEITRSDDAQVR